MLTIDSIRAILDQIRYRDWKFETATDGDAFTLQLRFESFDLDENQPIEWTGRKWRLSRHMTPGEIVQTAFLAVLTAEEHEAREQFRYRGAAIFGPHFDVEKLVSLCRRHDALEHRTEAN